LPAWIRIGNLELLTQLNPDPKHWVFVKQNDTLKWLFYLFELLVALKVLKAVFIHLKK
jgi:hypothetical protein